MRFFSVNQMKKIGDATKLMVVCTIPPATVYFGMQSELKMAENFQRKYPNAKVYFDPHMSGCIAGASSLVAEEPETGKIIARR